jgi:hypothetical protein
MISKKKCKIDHHPCLFLQALKQSRKGKSRVAPLPKDYESLPESVITSLDHELECLQQASITILVWFILSFLRH